MEYCEGGSLHAVLEEVGKLNGRMAEKALRPVARNVLMGLSYLDQHRIVHRDIKPSNILFSKDGEAKLCDFGVSCEIGPRGEADTSIGTSYYMAPERITGQKYTITSDVWSLGITLLEAAYSRFPFPNDGDEHHPQLALFDFLSYVVGEAIELRDEPDKNIRWGEAFKSFIECWYVLYHLADLSFFCHPVC
jgi:mitogen-activated protein kinase kinase